MIELIKALVKRGPATSEFWLALVALAAPWIAQVSPETVHAWADGRGIVGGLVVAVYIAARAYVKGQAARAIGGHVVDDVSAGKVAAQLQHKGP